MRGLCLRHNRIDEEGFLTVRVPTITKKVNCICGNALVSHYSYWKTRDYLETTDLLKQYFELAKNKFPFWKEIVESKDYKSNW